MARVCGHWFADTIFTPLSPRIEHHFWQPWDEGDAEVDLQWRLLPSSYWMWPWWPWGAYRPNVLALFGALVFVVGIALLRGRSRWTDGAGYLASLALTAAYGGLSVPGFRELIAVVLCVPLAKLAIRLLQLGVPKPLA